MDSNEPPHPLTTINFVNNLLHEHTTQNPPWKCLCFHTNHELEALKDITHREDFYQLESDSGVKIAAYQRDNGSYDEPDYEILTEKEWLALPPRPTRIHELEEEIRKAKDAEFLIGINHYKNYGDWLWGPEALHQIPIPQLQLRTPKQMMDEIEKEYNAGECDPKTCEKHHHCIYCGSTKVTNETFSDWYKCRSCHKQYEESDVQRYQTG